MNDLAIGELLEQTFSKSDLEILKRSSEFTQCLERILEIENLLPQGDAITRQ